MGERETKQHTCILFAANRLTRYMLFRTFVGFTDIFFRFRVGKKLTKQEQRKQPLHFWMFHAILSHFQICFSHSEQFARVGWTASSSCMLDWCCEVFSIFGPFSFLFFVIFLPFLTWADDLFLEALPGYTCSAFHCFISHNTKMDWHCSFPSPGNSMNNLKFCLEVTRNKSQRQKTLIFWHFIQVMQPEINR